MAQVDAARVNAALAETDPTRALNPFVDGPAGSPELLASLMGSDADRHFSRGRQVSAFLRGELFELPAGSVQAVLGGEWRAVMEFHALAQLELPIASELGRAKFRNTKAAQKSDQRNSLCSGVEFPAIAGDIPLGDQTFDDRRAGCRGAQALFTHRFAQFFVLNQLARI